MKKFLASCGNFFGKLIVVFLIRSTFLFIKGFLLGAVVCVPLTYFYSLKTGLIAWLVIICYFLTVPVLMVTLESMRE